MNPSSGSRVGVCPAACGFLLALMVGHGAWAEQNAFALTPPAVEPPSVAPRIVPGDRAYRPGEAIVAGETGTPDAAYSFDLLEADDTETWNWQWLPDGLVYPAYLAGVKESRLAGVLTYIDDEGWFLDSALGGRVGVIRYGAEGDGRPQGWQLDLEGAVFPRLDLAEMWDLVAADFRVGVPLTYASGRWEYKLAVYHLSSHVGDEFMLDHPDFVRLNYSRDVLVMGTAYRLLDAVRLYAEAGWSYDNAGGSEPWEFQFGTEYSPVWRDAQRGMPFAALNGHLREEVSFGGNVSLQAGWQWRSDRSGHLIRLGAEYFNGKSPQFEFFPRNEEHVGLGLWYDY